LCERAEDVVTCGRRYCHRGGWQSWKQGQNASKLKFLDENLDFSIIQQKEVRPFAPLIHHYKRKVSANARNFLSLTDGDITIVEGENDGSKGKTLVKYNFRRYGTGPFLTRDTKMSKKPEARDFGALKLVIIVRVSLRVIIL
jgi:hypothetical protein